MGAASVAGSEVLGEIVDPEAWAVGLMLGPHSCVAEHWAV